MGKKKGAKSETAQTSKAVSGLPFVASSAELDPVVASLFASSSGPVKAPPAARPVETSAKLQKTALAKDSTPDVSIDTDAESEAESSDADNVEEGSSASSDEADPEEELQTSESEVDNIPVHESIAKSSEVAPQRKRKRKNDEELEDKYMRRLAEEEARDEAKRKAERSRKRQKTATGEPQDRPSGESNEESDAEASADGMEESDDGEASVDRSQSPIPQHESLAPKKGDQELERASRTVFLANVSTEAINSKSAKKTLINHLSSFLSKLPASNPPHKVESLRFRSTAYASKIPKKAAFAKKELMDATTKSTNAYAVYSTQLAAREAAKRLNGTVVLGRHLRVDEVAHPAKMDHRRCVFVGNLNFVDDESLIHAVQEEEGKKKQKNKEPGDVEEGLWRQFGKAGTVESVRVVRDPQTRVGKGFAYVQFTDENAVEAALLFNDKKFPPLLPRKLRVVRAKSIKRNAAKKNAAASTGQSGKGIYRPKADPKVQSMQGRAGKLFGRAGAAQARLGRKESGGADGATGGSFKAPESFVFEGHRATSKDGKSGLKLGGGSKKKAGKPKSRSSKRGAAWKAAGGKKA